MNLRAGFLEVVSAGQLGPASTTGASIVNVTYNSEEAIAECLQSQVPTIGGHDEVIVVDNASQDGTVETVKRWVDASGVILSTITCIRSQYDVTGLLQKHHELHPVSKGCKKGDLIAITIPGEETPEVSAAIAV